MANRRTDGLRPEIAALRPRHATGTGAKTDHWHHAHNGGQDLMASHQVTLRSWGFSTLRVQPTPAIHPCAGFSFQACPSSNRPDFFLFTPSHCLKKKCDTRRPTLVGDVGDPLRGYGAGACATLAADVYPRRPPRFGPPKRTSNGSNRTCAGTCRRHSAFRRYAHDFTDTPIQTFDRHGVCRDAGLSSEHVLGVDEAG